MLPETNHESYTTCKYCNTKSQYFQKCRLCEKPVCIQHLTVVRVSDTPGGLAAECSNHPWACFGKRPESVVENAV